MSCNGNAIGFMLSPNDPYFVIDLDNKEDNPVSQEQWDSYNRLIEAADTYTEWSQSGRGIHIVGKGSIPAGLNRGQTEIYSQERFMIFTGNIIVAKPIGERQELATWFFNELGGEEAVKRMSTRVDQEATLSDTGLMEMAWNAENAGKFRDLWQGDWAGMGYPSQSEADYALLSMLCFYSVSDAQCLRLFRKSALGQRDKATRNDRYLMGECINKIRAKQPGPVNIPSLDELRASMQPKAPTIPALLPIGESSRAKFDIPFIYSAEAANLLPNEDLAPNLPGQIAGMPKPPGLIGEIADYIYSSASRPVAEIAMAAAMGLVAGIAGRAYNISRVGLNQYIVLIAKTGTGKEEIGKGIDAIFNAIRKFSPQADGFQGPAAFASGQGLYRVLTDKPVFVSVLGEFGMTLAGMGKARPGDAMHTLKRAMLDIYNKSGIGSSLKSTAYSDKEKNTSIVQAPNLTFVGESTPEEFYKALDESAVMDGFVPRLMLIEYKGDRPALNDNAGFPPPDALIAKLAALANTAVTASQQPEGAVAYSIPQNEDARLLLRQFNDEIDKRFQGLPDGPARQILNRAHLKALKLAGLLAVGVNYIAPVVTLSEAEWAVNFVRREADIMMKRFDSGEVGEGEDPHRFEKAVRGAIERLFSKDKAEARILRNGYKVPTKLEGTSVITRSFIGQYLKGRQPFKGDKRGAGKAIEETLREMVAEGVLVEVPKLQLQQTYGLTSPAYIPGSQF